MDGMGKVLSKAHQRNDTSDLSEKKHPCSFQILEPTWQHAQGYKPMNVHIFQRFCEAMLTWKTQLAD